MILDTTFWIEAERAGLPLSIALSGTEDVAIAAVTAAELLEGVERADRRRRGTRSAYVEMILGAITIEDYDLKVARRHALLLAHTRRTGRPRGPHDLIIAATAAATGRTVVTLDPAGFEDLPGVSVRSER